MRFPAGVAQLVERHLPKVEVASSSLVSRSTVTAPRERRTSDQRLLSMQLHRSARAWLAIPVIVAMAVAGCSQAPTNAPSPTPTASPRPSGSGSGALSLAQLKYQIMSRFGVLLYCDPDEYPVAHGDEQQLATARLPEIQQDAETYAAITHRLGIGPQADLDAAQTLAAYREWKLLNALVLQPADGGYRFDAIFAPALNAQQGTRVAGFIASDGTIGQELQQTTSGPPPCPICLAKGTRIATPSGEVPVEELSVGALVLTTDRRGDVVVAAIAKLGSAAVPPDHIVVRIILDDGRSVTASPGHPLADGRLVGSLRPGDQFDGGTVRSTTRVRYRHERTYDLLPSGETGVYWANGILLGSTLRR
jgi:Hint domain-containing protein